MSAKTIERRFLRGATSPIEVRAGEKGGAVLSGYASVFFKASDPGTRYELWDGYEERIMPGAFDRAMREDDVRGLVNHDPNQLLGRTKSGTMRLSVDDKGLRYEIDVPDTADGRDTVTKIRRGDLDGSSFAFVTTDEEWVKEGGTHVRNVKGVQLFDVGPVTYPAYEATTADARSAIEGRAEAALRAAPSAPCQRSVSARARLEIQSRE